MTRDDIIRMARSVRDGGHWNQLDLINFAYLIAAAAHEACAKVAEDMCEYGKPYSAAAAIRERSNT